MVRAISELQRAGVEPDIWKIEGLDAPDDCVRVVAQARAGGRSRVACIVLGRGASETRVAQWLRTAAPVSGFCGFAVGRTIWLDALEAYRDRTLGPTEAAEQIADRYLRAIEVYTSAAHGVGGSGAGDPGRRE
jgi:myo-inositol catabolism protein IolC